MKPDLVFGYYRNRCSDGAGIHTTSFVIDKSGIVNVDLICERNFFNYFFKKDLLQSSLSLS
jgi:hypothetical protein